MFMLLLCGLKIPGLTTTTPQQKLRKKSSLCVLKVLEESTKESK